MFKENTQYEILTPSGYKPFIGVQKLTKECIKFVFEDGSDCEVSKGHKFYIDGNVIISDDIRIGDNLYHKDMWYNKVISIEYTGSKDVYDLVDVEGGSVFYADDFLHHNCCFLGSSATIIDGKTLIRLTQGITHPVMVDMKGRMRVWEKPTDGATYVMGVDTSKGVGSDYSVIQVFRILGIKPVSMVQVAVWEDNFTDVYNFSDIVNRVSYYYNNAYIMCENNAEGSVVVNRLWWDFENENLINTGTKNKDLGIRATGQTKPSAVLLMKKLIEDGSIVIYDKNTVDQLSDFQDLGNNKYACVNCNDDCATSLYWALYILEQQVFDEAYEFSNGNSESEEGWGLLADWGDANGIQEDWSWMNKYSLT